MELQCIEAHVIDDPDRMVEEIISALIVKREQGTGDAWNDRANTELCSMYGANCSASARIPYVSKRSRVKSLTPYIPLIPEVGLIGRDDIVDRVSAMCGW